MGAIFGNILSGVVAQYVSWKWVFWILAMIACVVTVAAHFLIPLPVHHPSEADLKHAVDWVGGTIVTVALFILLFALTEGNIVGWRQPYIPAIIVVSIILLVLFVAWQWYLENKTVRRPVVKVSLFKNLRVSAVMFTMVSIYEQRSITLLLTL